MNEKNIPFSIEAECGVLGSILIDPMALDEVMGQLRAEDFYRDAHRLIYATMVDLARRRITPDSLTLCDELERLGHLEHVGRAFINSLINEVPTSGNILHYASIVSRKATSRRLIHAAGQIAAYGYAENEHALEEADKLLLAVGGQTTGSDFSFAPELIDSSLDNLMAIYSGKKSLRGVPTGFQGIDYYLGGLQKSDLIILAARPSVGKSSYMLSVAYHAALVANMKVGIFSLEMSKDQLMLRLISYETHIDLYRLRNGYIHDDEWERIFAARDRLSSANLAIDDTGGITLSALRNKARRLKATRGVDLIIVDYLQLMHADTGNRDHNREREVAEISGGLKELAKELDVPVLALAQLSRAVEGRQNKKPQLSDLRESGAIENDADVVQFIYREELYFPDTERKGLAEIIIGKHRNGPVGSVDLHFNASETRFEEIYVEGGAA